MFARHWQFFAFLLLILTILLPALALFDGLIEHEYEWQRDAWEADGRPGGYIWRPPGSRVSMNTTALFLIWLFRSPPWVRESRSCQRSVFWMRILMSLWLLGLLLIGFGNRIVDYLR